MEDLTQRNATIRSMWCAGKKTPEIKAAIADMPGGSIGINAIKRLAGKLGAKRPAWYLSEIGLLGGTASTKMYAWSEDEDRIAKLLYEAKPSIPPIVKALREAGYNRARTTVRRRLIALGLIKEADPIDAEPEPAPIIIKPIQRRIVRVYKAPKPISPEPWGGVRRISRATGFSMLRGQRHDGSS